MVRRLASFLLPLAILGAPLLVLAQDPPETPPPAGSAEPPEPLPPPGATATDVPAPPPPPSAEVPPPPVVSSVARPAPPPPVASSASARTPPPASARPVQPPPPPEQRRAPPVASGDGGTKKDDGKKDEGDKERGWEWLWLSGEGGVQHLSLTTLQSEGTLTPGIEKSAVTGPFAGVAAGFRLWILTVGARARAAQFNQFMYWSLDPEVTLHFGTQGVQPYLLFGAGYSALGSLDQGSLSNQAGAKIRGFNVRAGFGLDVYVTHTISLGLLGTGEVTAMTRPGVSASDLQVSGQTGGNIDTSNPQQSQAQAEAARAEAEAKAAKVDGSGVGLAGALSVVLGLHF